MPTRSLFLYPLLMLAFALAFSACGPVEGEQEEDENSQNNDECGAFCFEENATSGNSSTNSGNSSSNSVPEPDPNQFQNDDPNIGSNNHSFTDSVEQICTDACTTQIECDEISEPFDQCVDTCMDDAEVHIDQSDPDCVDANLELGTCASNLSCSEFNNAEIYCEDELAALLETCDFGEPEPEPQPEPEPEPELDPESIQERVETICQEGCDQYAECEDFDVPPECADECVEEAFQSREDSGEACFEAEVEFGECITSLSCSEIDDLEIYCADEIDAAEEVCPATIGSGTPGG